IFPYLDDRRVTTLTFEPTFPLRRESAGIVHLGEKGAELVPHQPVFPGKSFPGPGTDLRHRITSLQPSELDPEVVLLRRFVRKLDAGTPVEVANDPPRLGSPCAISRVAAQVESRQEVDGILPLDFGRLPAAPDRSLAGCARRSAAFHPRDQLDPTDSEWGPCPKKEPRRVHGTIGRVNSKPL